MRFKTRSFSLVGLLVALGLMSAAPASAADFTVTRVDDPAPNGCAPGDCSLREAVIDANALAGADTVILKSGATYRLSIPGAAIAQGDVDILDDLTIRTSGPAKARVEGRGIQTGDRTFRIAGADVTMDHLIVATGRAPDELFGANHEARGGGIFVESGSLAFNNGRLVDNRTQGGNPPIGLGGAIYNAGTLTLTNAVISGSEAGLPSFGGGVFTQGGASTTAVRTTVRNNVASFGGGFAGSGNLTVIDSAIVGNDAGLGAGIYSGSNVPGTITVTNSTISGNIAAGKGGAIRVRNGMSLVLENATITDNTSDSGPVAPFEGGAVSLQTDPATPAASVSYLNTIVAGNTDVGGGDQDDCHIEGAVTVTSLGFNIIGNDNGCGFVASTGDQVGTAVLPLDAMLDTLGMNGGPTPTHPLLPGSPALDNGSSEAPGSSATACKTLDQRGVGRTDCDVGAYELVTCQGVTVNRVGTSGPDSLIGTPDADGFLSFAGQDQINGRAGNDAACSGPGDDVILGGAGNDSVLAGPGQDLARGVAGNDTLDGGTGADRLLGGLGNDTLKGGAGPDTCAGGPGNDTATSCEQQSQVP
jgi:hemolysin type calcium-binding protein